MDALRRLRIAFVADTLQAPVGGGMIAGRHLVERLRDRHAVTVVGADGDGEGRLRGFQLPLKAMRESHFVMARPQRARLRRALAPADVVHLQFPFWLSFRALAEARRQGKPVVAAFHVQPENALLNVGVRARWLIESTYRLWVEKLYNRVDAVVCPTRFAEEKLKGHGLTAPSLVISNGVPPDLTPGPSEREPAHEGHFLVLMLGRLAAEKRQEDLLAALRRSRHAERIRVVIAGAGPRQAELERLARGLPHPPEIGFLPRDRLVRLLRSADLLVHCSEVELEGIAVLEAMSVGLPVLVADAPESAASRFALNEAFRFPVGDVAALAAKLDALIDDRPRLEAARQAYRRVAQTLDFEASVSRLEALYRAVAQHRPGEGSSGHRPA